MIVDNPSEEPSNKNWKFLKSIPYHVAGPFILAEERPSKSYFMLIFSTA